MAVFSLPKEFESLVPRYESGQPYEALVKAEEEFVAKLATWAKARAPQDAYAGSVVRWPMADGYAQYLVAATKPVELIHLPIGDAWDFPLAHRATKKDIVGRLDADKAWAEMVAKSKPAA